MHPFKTPGLGLLKTFVMVIGEFEYDSGFSDNENSDSDPPVFAYILFVLFIIVMTILLMNLLVRYSEFFVSSILSICSVIRRL